MSPNYLRARWGWEDRIRLSRSEKPRGWRASGRRRRISGQGDRLYERGGQSRDHLSESLRGSSTPSGTRRAPGTSEVIGQSTGNRSNEGSGVAKKFRWHARGDIA